MEFHKQTYRDGDYRIVIDEAEDYALICLKDGDDYFLALKIRVMKKCEDGKEREYAYYFREFDKMPNIAHVSRFIDKFLSDVEYRKQYFIDGKPWEGAVKNVLNENSPINPRCAAAIKKICSKKESKLKFKDFASLKTYGPDGFSRMKLDKLAGIIGENAIDEMDKAFPDNPAMHLSACRWVARGLKPQYAIRKVKTDAEIANNARC